MLEARGQNVRTIHYDRNLGKGYAVKIGALEGRGRWIAFMDADLDLEPSRLPEFLEVAKAEQLDFAIGSKRHRESDVVYPRSRRIASRLYQSLVHILFRLDVRDTQVGMKLFRREIADEVIPLLLVKRYAFDLELLAVSRAIGYRRIRELPITLDYQFTGSGVRSLAVLHALVDTFAIFYRLRVLRYYQRKRRLLGEDLTWSTPPRRGVSIITTDPDALAALDWPDVEMSSSRRSTWRACGLPRCAPRWTCSHSLDQVCVRPATGFQPHFPTSRVTGSRPSSLRRWHQRRERCSNGVLLQSASRVSEADRSIFGIRRGISGSSTTTRRDDRRSARSVPGARRHPAG